MALRHRTVIWGTARFRTPNGLLLGRVSFSRCLASIRRLASLILSRIGRIGMQKKAL